MNTTHHTPETLLHFLAQNGISYTATHHAPIFTAAETPAEIQNLPGIDVRNMFLYDKKNNHYLITLPLMAPPVDLKTLRTQLNAPSNFSFCSAERLLKHLGVTPGSVTPYALINDLSHTVQPILHAPMFQAEFINAHPLVNNQTISTTPQNLLKFFTLTGHQPQLINLPFQSETPSIYSESQTNPLST